jgi:hypothetical protein
LTAGTSRILKVAIAAALLAFAATGNALAAGTPTVPNVGTPTAVAPAATPAVPAASSVPTVPTPPAVSAPSAPAAPATSAAAPAKPSAPAAVTKAPSVPVKTPAAPAKAPAAPSAPAVTTSVKQTSSAVAGAAKSTAGSVASKTGSTVGTAKAAAGSVTTIATKTVGTVATAATSTVHSVAATVSNAAGSSPVVGAVDRTLAQVVGLTSTLAGRAVSTIRALTVGPAPSSSASHPVAPANRAATTSAQKTWQAFAEDATPTLDPLSVAVAPARSLTRPKRVGRAHVAPVALLPLLTSSQAFWLLPSVVPAMSAAGDAASTGSAPDRAPGAPLPGPGMSGAAASGTGTAPLLLFAALLTTLALAAPRLGRWLRSTPDTARLQHVITIEAPG